MKKGVLELWCCGVHTSVIKGFIKYLIFILYKINVCKKKTYKKELKEFYHLANCAPDLILPGSASLGQHGQPIVGWFPMLSNIVQYCLILSNIVH